MRLYDGKYHDVDSDQISFEIAGRMGFRDAARRAQPVLMEPIMAVEVITPDEYMGDVIGDLNGRRGRIGQMGQRNEAQVITAMVPLSEMFGYSTDLRSITQGRALYTMQFETTRRCPSRSPRRSSIPRPSPRKPRLLPARSPSAPHRGWAARVHPLPTPQLPPYPTRLSYGQRRI